MRGIYSRVNPFTRRRRTRRHSRPHRSPATEVPAVYAPTTRGPLYAFDRSSGRELWRVRSGARRFSAPAIAGDRLFIGGEDGALYALALTAPAPLRRLIFWDDRFGRISLFADDARLRDYLAPRGYRVVDARGLAAALDPASAPGRVVVFAIDLVPRELLGTPATSPFRSTWRRAAGWCGPVYHRRSGPATPPRRISARGRSTGRRFARSWTWVTKGPTSTSARSLVGDGEEVNGEQ
jgi:hypothetical protein